MSSFKKPISLKDKLCVHNILIIKSMVTHRLFGDPIMLITLKNSRVDGLTSAILTTYEMLFFNMWANRTRRPPFFILILPHVTGFADPGHRALLVCTLPHNSGATLFRPIGHIGL
jgi:hypothetical protein